MIYIIRWESDEFMIKKKIGLCICYDTYNYGSMLQSYATCKIIKKMDYSYEIINYSRKLTIGLLFRSITKIPHQLKSRIIGKKEKKRISKIDGLNQNLRKRHEYFKKFIDENFENSLSNKCDTLKQLTSLSRKYDIVLVGSDQLWNPTGYSTRFYNLLFVDENVKKISYATSFGVSNIPNSKKRIAKKFLNRLDAIGVREIRGKEIIEELTGRSAQVVLDPTLLFNQEEWLEFIPNSPKIINDKYILCYLLGDNVCHRNAVSEFARKRNLKVVTLPFLDKFVEVDLDFGDYKLFDIGPQEFLNLIRNAEYVFTDSFHGTVFSILNKKQFITFNRFSTDSKNSRNSRIDSLFSLLGLEDRRSTDMNFSKIDYKIDYDAVDSKLDLLRKKSLDYLGSSLKLE